MTDIPIERRRNFCIIAHIDHGKSTLADRIIQLTGGLADREMKAQVLDSMDLERERGITIKAASVRLTYKARDGQFYLFNLIDTPGHVDFHYEVSRALASCEGAILVVDASQGVQAQTLANVYAALDQNLEILPVLNKIDLPNADPDRIKKEVEDIIGIDTSEAVHCSAKAGIGIEDILEQVVQKVPMPKGSETAPLQALIFDSWFDSYQGVIILTRVFNGRIKIGDKIRLMSNSSVHEVLQVGAFMPKPTMLPALSAGEVGFVIAGVKEISDTKIGDTITQDDNPCTEPLVGFREVKPMVYAGVFPKEGSTFERLREAIGKLKLSDAALQFEPEHSPALGYGFRIGLLGMLHLEIITQRLEREFNMDLVVTVPSVVYQIHLKGAPTPSDSPSGRGRVLTIKSPLEMPDVSHIDKIEEPWASVDMVTPKDYIGPVMQLAQERKGIYKTTDFLSDERVILRYEMPLSAVIVDFYDTLKSASSGYASLNYDLIGYREADVIRLTILVAEEPVEALSTLVYREDAEKVGRRIVEKLKDSIPQAMFDIKIQAAIGGKIIAAERIAAMKKDVIAKLYGGDVSRKNKLLDKQKKGKKKMMAMGVGKVNIPTDAYLNVLKR